MRPITRDRGLTLVELAIAILVLSIGTIAAMRGLDHATRTAAGAEARALAQIAVRNRAEELRLLGPDASLPETVTLDGRAVTLDEDRTVTAGGLVRLTLTARVPGAAGAQLVVYLDPGPRG
ncbi:prepilin-type N-terminal cleavage/methylation domain-containing protein [uncultured Tateyamaria sp.]|uniref:type IV pilus modification PilV family protein n=1 Tax=Tateyamaria sp. 1078 TaxID=3417464 RepID=UPI00261599EF|nr:prepilin-type N-terminal cleavage/methylation domain-containing protein [uncultured Tateyamaria sp.]